MLLLSTIYLHRSGPSRRYWPQLTFELDRPQSGGDITTLLMKRSLESDPDEEAQGSESKSILLQNNLPVTSTESGSIVCSIPPCSKHPKQFSTTKDFEAHYYRYHGFVCSECKRTFPTEHILNLHVTENHDSFAQAKKARGDKIYGCFVPTCDRFCSEERTRRRHVIDKHGYPPNYYFKVVKYGLQRGQISLLG